MTQHEFERALSLTRASPDSRSVQAARLVLVDSTSVSEAARRAGVTRHAVDISVARLRKMAQLDHCPTCGQRVAP